MPNGLALNKLRFGPELIGKTQLESEFDLF